jgi:uncharacterized membrane protein YdjX (TVP38/TMEM64 family)
MIKCLAKVGRRISIILTPLAIAAGIWFFYATPTGCALRQEDVLRRWIVSEPTLAPLLFVVVYSLIGLLAMPVWWMQIVAGHCFGLAMGLLRCHVGAAISAAISMQLARWLVTGSIPRRIEPYRQHLRRLDERLGHNALLLVTAARLSHVMPFGITNYLFGLTRMRLADVIVGTILGGTLSKMIHVAVGADAHLLASEWYLVALVAVNLALLSPLALLYLRPRWLGRLRLSFLLAPSLPAADAAEAARSPESTGGGVSGSY